MALLCIGKTPAQPHMRSLTSSPEQEQMELQGVGAQLVLESQPAPQRATPLIHRPQPADAADLDSAVESVRVRQQR